MADKTININGVDVGRGTGIKIDQNPEVSTEKTFDGVISFGLAETEYTISIDKIVAPTIDKYRELRDVLKDMKSNKGNITIRENVKDKEGNNYEIKEIFGGCLVSKYSKEIKVDSLTTESIEFTAETMEDDF